jgi:hypothetical protein
MLYLGKRKNNFIVRNMFKKLFAPMALFFLGTGSAFAQTTDSSLNNRISETIEELIALGFVLGFMIFIGIVIYLMISIPLHKIAKSKGIANAWLAWVPLGNLWIISRIAGYEGGIAILTTIGLMFPYVNIPVLFWLTYKTAKNLQRNVLLALILTFIFYPFTLIYFAYLGESLE